MPCLWSPFAIEECVERLNAATDPPLRLFGRSKVIGGVWGWTFSGVHRAPLDYRSLVQVKIYAKLRRASEGGTLLQVGIRPRTFTLLFLPLWFGAVVAVLGAMIWTAARGGDISVMGIAVPLIMLVGGGAMVRAAWVANRGDPAFLRRFVADIVNAEER